MLPGHQERMMAASSSSLCMNSWQSAHRSALIQSPCPTILHTQPGTMEAGRKQKEDEGSGRE